VAQLFSLGLRHEHARILDDPPTGPGYTAAVNTALQPRLAESFLAQICYPDRGGRRAPEVSVHGQRALFSPRCFDGGESERIALSTAWPNNSMQRMGASRSVQLQFVRQRRLAPTADAERSAAYTA